ncbi:granzyme E-like isoform X3 [Acomys russatus]|uniref:granzyme E-like isoform X3 n=1 Tax=Acomys russatus TaxID=60746 RepID=UPI0021E2A8F5|nr:granzyme E-like isoform X3 [Acomys russatus]
MAPVLILLAFLLPLGAHAEEIIGGHEVTPHSRPYMAFVRSLKEDGNRSRCGGFLVQDNFVLTAAHCWGSSMRVTLGAHNIKAHEQSQQIIRVAKAIPHPKYNSENKINDIMLLKLERKAKRSKAVKLLKFPRANARGDSGGPLVCDNRAYGVCARVNKDTTLDVVTKISSFLPWIRRNMKLP